MTQTDYYSIQKILQIMKDYHRNIQNVSDMERETMRSFGVAQYGVEAAMPKASGISKVVENEALRRVESSKFWSNVCKDAKYIQDRMYRVTDETYLTALHLRLDGYSVCDIARYLEVDRSTAYRILRRVAKLLKGSHY